MHLIRHATDVKSSAKENIRRPTKMALTILVAAKSTTNSMIANRMLPNIPNKRVEITEHKERHDAAPFVIDTESRVIAKKVRAIIITLCSIVGVRAIAAVICRKAAMIPMIRLATKAIPVQLHLVSQFEKDIFIHLSIIIYE